MLTPFGSTLVERIQAATEGFDPSKMRADWPRAQLDITLSGGMQADDRFVGELAVQNRMAGPVDAKRIPVATLNAAINATTSNAKIERLVAQLARGGTVRGTGQYEPGKLSLDLTSDDLDLSAVWSSLHSTRLAGNVAAALTEKSQQLRGTLRDQAREPPRIGGVRLPSRLALEFDATRTDDRLDLSALTLRAGKGSIDLTGLVMLSGEGRFQAKGAFTDFDPSVIGQFPIATLNAAFTGSGQLLGAREGEIQARVHASRWRGYPVEGTVGAAFKADRLASLDADLAIAGNQLKAQGALGSTADTLRWSIDAPYLARLGLGIDGALRANGVASGAWDTIGTDINASATSIGDPNAWSIGTLNAEGRYEMATESALRVTAKSLTIGTTVIDSLTASIAGTTAKHRAELEVTGNALEGRALVSGGLDDAHTWRGTIEQLQSTKPLAATLKAPAALTASAERLAVDGAVLLLWEGEVHVDTFALAGELVSSRGRLAGLELRSILPPELGAESDLRVSGTWDVRADQTLSGKLALTRDRGDLRTRGEQGVIALGLTHANVAVTAERNQLSATLDAAGSQLGTLDVRADTQASKRDGRWGIAGTAPLGGSVRMDMPSIAWLSAFAPPSIVLSGAAQGQLALAGTVGAPAPRGTLQGDNLRLVFPQSDIVLSKGQARVDFDATTATLREAVFRGDAGSLNASGAWALQSPFGGELALRFEGLDAITDPNRAVKLTGRLDAKISRSAVDVRGNLRADEGRVRLPDGEAPRLGTDVTIVNAPTASGRSGATSTRGQTSNGVARQTLNPTPALNVDIEADLGERFRLQGRGVEALLAGKIRVRTTADGAVRLFGTVNVQSGTVNAYGQTLVIERGTITFNGPTDNPQLNLFAIRRGLPVRVGVQVTGFALEPRATLFSDPPMPDNQRLSWLVLGRSPEGLSATDLTLLGSAATAILSGDAPPLQSRIAGAVGLDELAVRSTGAVESAVVAIGKRVSDKLYVTVERSVMGLGTALALRYQFNRNWSLQGQTGLHNTVDLFYTITFN